MIDVASEKLAKYNSICLLIDNNIECIVAYCACLRLKIPVYICNPNTNTEKTREICEYYGFDAIVKRQKSTSNETKNILDNLLFQKIDNGVNTRISKEIALMLSTSGTTGKPKLVKLSHRNIETNTKGICERLEITSDDIHITTLPAYYTYGLSCINTHLYKGAKIVLNNNSIVEKEFWAKIEKGETHNNGGCTVHISTIDAIRYKETRG